MYSSSQNHLRQAFIVLDAIHTAFLQAHLVSCTSAAVHTVISFNKHSKQEYAKKPPRRVIALTLTAWQQTHPVHCTNLHPHCRSPQSEMQGGLLPSNLVPASNACVCHCVCMCVTVCVCVYVCARHCVCMCVRLCVSLCVYVCHCMCVTVCACVSLCVYVCAFVVSLCVTLCVLCVSLRVYVCTFVRVTVCV